MPQQPKKEVPFRVGHRACHPHFDGIGKIDSFLNNGNVAVIKVMGSNKVEDTHYVRTQELKRPKDENA